MDKPAWAPPAGVFGPAWTALYTASGVAGWRLWTHDAGRTVLGLHVTQLALNAAVNPDRTVPVAERRANRRGWPDVSHGRTDGLGGMSRG